MVSFVKSVTFDCAEPMAVAAFWAAALGSTVDEDSTSERAWVEPAGWGGPTLWFQRVPERKIAKNRQHFDLRAVGDLVTEVRRLEGLGAAVRRTSPELVVMADPEGNEFCVEE
ncbi:VOC family protein [Flexivirga caeni]|uniref:VOC family protein n=1 Tax=Flexivirga caeni TaxID=2294115 RepID=A0A3M9MH73_9MICO|nr:VOC family protein [Flexivirga caeni]RNI24909.1 VOC family protein [Flexivirga caeni]